MINCSCVGSFGRWGNSLHQYAFAKYYADSLGVALHIPEGWAGREVFSSVNEPPITQDLPRVNESDINGQDNIDIWGYFQAKPYISKLNRANLKSWLQPRNKVEGPKIAIHKRRGDYLGISHYAVVSDESYEAALEKFGYDMKDAKIYSDESDSDPYQDFLEIMNAEVIFRANSTFSWWAATLSNATVYSPLVEDRGDHGFYEFVEGNHPKLCHLFEDLHLKE